MSAVGSAHVLYLLLIWFGGHLCYHFVCFAGRQGSGYGKIKNKESFFSPLLVGRGPSSKAASDFG